MTLMTRYRKLAAGLTACALLVGACGDDGSDDAASGGGEGSCDSSDELLIGTIFPLTGVTADTGDKATIGAEIAVEELNADGGVLGRCVTLVPKDEANDPTEAAQAASELIDRDEVAAIVGPAGSGPTGAVAPIATDAGIPYVAYSSLSLPRDEAPGGFTVQITSNLIGPSFIDYAESVGWQSLAIIATNTTFGTSIVDAVEDNAGDAGIDVTTVETHESGAVDLGPQMRELRDSAPDAVVVASFGGDAIVALKAREQLGWDVPVIGPSGLSFEEVVDGVGPAGMEGVYSSMYPARLAADPATGELPERGEAFRQAVKEHVGAETITDNLDAIALGYDALMSVAHGIDGAESTEAEAVADVLIEEGFSGVRADYVWTDDSNEGFTLESNAIVVAASLDDGVLTLAPTS